MTVTAVLTADDVIDAIINADTYRMKAADTGLYDIIDTLIDADLALKKACISEKHLNILFYRWALGYEQKDIADKFSITQQSVSVIEARTKVKIQRVLDGWGKQNV